MVVWSLIVFGTNESTWRLVRQVTEEENTNLIMVIFPFIRI